MGGAVLAEPLYQKPHLRRQGVDTFCLSIKECTDGSLFIDGRERKQQALEFLAVDVHNRYATPHVRFLISAGRTISCIAEEGRVGLDGRAEDNHVSPAVSRPLDQVGS